PLSYECGNQATLRELEEGQVTMDLGLKDKTALVLGAGGGLGGAIAATLAAEGAAVALADISMDAAQATAGAIVADGGRALALEWDLADLDAIPGRIAAIEQAFGP